MDLERLAKQAYAIVYLLERDGNSNFGIHPFKRPRRCLIGDVALCGNHECLEVISQSRMFEEVVTVKSLFQW